MKDLTKNITLKKPQWNVMDIFRALSLFTISTFFSFSAHGVTPAPSISSYPLKTTLWLSISKSHVAPAQTLPLTSNFEGYLQINLPNQSYLKKDQIWAIRDPKRLELSESSIALEESKLHQTIKTTQLDHLDSISAQEDKLAHLIIEQKKITVALNTPELINHQKIKAALKTSLKKMGEQISRDQQRLTDLQNETTLQNEISRLKLDFQKKQNTHQQLKQSSELKAPFDGTLNLQIPPPTPETKYPTTTWVNAGEAIGTLSNTDRFEISIQAPSPTLSQVSQHTLFLKINEHRPDLTIQANYLRSKSTDQPLTQTPTLIFQVIAKDTLKAQEQSNTQPLAHIYTKLPKNCHIIPKSALLTHLNQQENQSSWQNVIQDLWPRSQLIAIGKTSLAVQPPSQP